MTHQEKDIITINQNFSKMEKTSKKRRYLTKDGYHDASLKKNYNNLHTPPTPIFPNKKLIISDPPSENRKKKCSKIIQKGRKKKLSPRSEKDSDIGKKYLGRIEIMRKSQF